MEVGLSSMVGRDRTWGGTHVAALHRAKRLPAEERKTSSDDSNREDSDEVNEGVQAGDVSERRRGVSHSCKGKMDRDGMKEDDREVVGLMRRGVDAWMNESKGRLR